MAEVIRGLDKWLEPHAIPECSACDGMAHDEDTECDCLCHLSPVQRKRRIAEMRYGVRG